MKQYIPILSIAGSDSSGGAGIQADIKTISALGCYAMTAITAITAQNTLGVNAIQGIDPEIVKAQLEAVFADIRPLAVKTGMLYDRANVEAAVEKLEQYKAENIVVDPVMVSTSGSLLIEEKAIDFMVDRLLPLATLVTPNRSEAVKLTGATEPLEQAMRLRQMGCRNILLKGGDSERTDTKVDYLLLEGDDDLTRLTADAVATENTHGTGCTLSSAIATYLACGRSVLDATMRGKLFITRALQAGARVKCGAGHGPANHLFNPRHAKFLDIKKYERKD